jgi:DNA-directed RNA polymerase subunit RPC12/RpoP
MATRRTPSFDRLEASLLACPQCRVAVPVRKRLLLILPEGDKYEYVCPRCGATCGDTIQKQEPPAPRRPF